ncbi:hypothetical protein MAR_024339 [Mya arenaria]|uniref:Uncharacterized protein n=1 Tax=Mya arenaria TaxID=6604 RepID=A0ABY7DTN7_MYAAR|nr:hypothetical protein MAR_024339 [Mya arenaria]
MAALADGNRESEIFNHPGSKTKSYVWKVFGFQKIALNLPPTKDNLNMNIAICRLCKKTYKNTVKQLLSSNIVY